MDTKLKSNNQNNVIGIFLSALIIISLAIGIIASYQPVLGYSERLSQKLQTQREESFKEQKENYTLEFMKSIARGNYVLYWDLLMEKYNSSQLPSEVFMTDEMKHLQDEDIWYQQKEEFINGFNDILSNWHNDFYSGTMRYYPLLEYYIVDPSTGNQLTSTSHSINRLLEDSEEGKELKTKYPFYIIYSYDEAGDVEISDYSGLTQEQIKKLLSMLQNNEVVMNDMYDNIWYQFSTQIKAPTNITIIYASQSENFYYTEAVMHNNSLNPIWDFSEGGFKYVCVFAVILVVLLALLLPVKKSWGIGQSFAARVPFELIAIGVLITISAYEGLLAMAWETTTGFFLMELNYTILSAAALHILDYGLNFIIWVAVIWIWYVATLSVRQVLIKGLVRYLKENTITGRLLGFIIRNINKVFASLGNIDLTDRSNKAIIKILIVNFVILTLLCSIWIIGIAVLIPYSILLFLILRKYFEEIKKKYSLLLEAASKMAEGNLEVRVEEDLGVFEPLKEEFGKVAYGFKKAVEEEMKSQRLKTDLITNVSHDLKTPLTAIITYIDLLKDENITQEERNSYIDTLDMKSQRLKRLIEDLFEVSKASSNNVTLNIMDIDLVDLIKQVLLELDDKISGSEVELRVHFPEERVFLRLDSEKTYRIFENLITNITKYAMPHSRAYITMELDNDKVVIVLKNVSATELDFSTEEITERFVRGDQARNTEGSGLGLAIVKSFVELQGGKFQILVDGDLYKAVITWNRG